MQKSTPTKLSAIHWITNDSYRIWLHVFFWVFLYVGELLSVLGVTHMDGINPYTLLFFLFIDMATIYLNLYILIPAFLWNNRIIPFLGFSIISIFINIELRFFLRFELACVECDAYEGASVFHQVLTDFARTTFVLGSAIGANIMRRYVLAQNKLSNLEKDTLLTELNFLKSQINPHVLFNALNTIYVQTRVRPRDAGESVLILSDLMRYQLYECTKDYVNLKDEIEYLKNYLRLDKLRKAHTIVSFDVSGKPENYKVAPFLFIPFIENAVKHGVEANTSSTIDINFKLDRQIYFKIENSKPSVPNKQSVGGIGLKNIQRRLDLLYEGKYDLQINNTVDKYIVEMRLKNKGF